MKKKAFITILLALVAVTILAQTDSDMLYIMPNKDVYETGEDLWFKAYLMDRQTLALSDKSQTLYLQMRNEAGEVVWNGKYLLTAGRGDGQIYIDENWPQQEYYLEGYTRSSFTSDTTIAIRPRHIRVVERVTQMDTISSEAVKRDSIDRLTTKHRFDLFPEGGHLIDGINSVVAFKATYGNGMPEEVSGRVMENGREIETFKSQHDGMGSFTLTPRREKDYQVVLADGRSFPLPEIQRFGMTLRVTRNNKSGIIIMVSASDDYARPFTILAKMRGMACCRAKGTVKGHQKVKMPLETFPMQGIAEITLLDGDHPVSERLVYVNPRQRLNITSQTDHQQYNRRDGGKVRLHVTDPSGDPVKAELAVSIFDKTYLYQPDHETILSHCYLSEEIRGSIFNPTYYYDERNGNRLQALDLLLMTQGWRRYVWDREPLEAHPLLTEELNGKDKRGQLLILKAFTAEGDTCIIMSDSIGRFSVSPMVMDQMRGSFYLQPLNRKPKPKLVLENPFDSINNYLQGRPRYLTQNLLTKTYHKEKYITDGLGTLIIKDVHVKGKRHITQYDKVLEYLDSLYIMSTGAWVCEHPWGKYINDYHNYSHHPGGTPFWEYHGGRLLPKRGEAYGRFLLEEHGGRWWDMACKMGPITFDAPRYNKEELLDMFNMESANGYHPRKEFYEPDPLDYSPSIPDPRNTLQWKPSILTDNNGKAEVSFITSDINTEFIGIVEAIDGTGLLGSHSFTFHVIRNK